MDHPSHRVKRAMEINGAMYGWGRDGVGVFSDSDRHCLVMERSGLSGMTLRRFISLYAAELEEYYGEYFGEGHQHVESLYGDTLVFVLVDLLSGDSVPKKIRKKIRCSGKWRRNKLRHKWSYKNPLNRIHGFLIMKDVTNTGHPQKTYSINTIASSFFSEKKGVGYDLMNLAKIFAKESGAEDIVLQVSNGYSSMGFPDDSEDEYSSEGESDEDYSEEGETEDEEDEEEEYEDYVDLDTMKGMWYPDEDSLDILTNELWKKCVRKDRRGIPHYNLASEYINYGLSSYFDTEMNSEDENLWKGTGKNSVKDVDEPGDTEYGGFWYQKGRRSQKRLMGFYEMHGYREDPDVHINWCCFSDIPYPTMRLKLV